MRAVWGHVPPGNFCTFRFSQVTFPAFWHHFFQEFFYKVFILFTKTFGVFLYFCYTRSDCKKVLKINKQFFSCFQNFMINRENLIKIGSAGGNASNRETPDQIEWDWNLWKMLHHNTSSQPPKWNRKQSSANSSTKMYQIFKNFSPKSAKTSLKKGSFSFHNYVHGKIQTQSQDFIGLCTYECKSHREGGGWARARGGDLTNFNQKSPTLRQNILNLLITQISVNRSEVQ